MDNGALADRKTPGYRKTALIYSNNVEISRLLLEKGADINHESGYGDTPLSHAVEDENLPLVKFLLEQGANASSTYSGGRKLFLDVAARHKLGTVKLFLDYITQAEIDEAYELAVLLSDAKLEEILRQAEGDYLDKEKLFDRAVETEKIAAVERLLKEGMDTYLKTKKGSNNLIISFPDFPSSEPDLQMTQLLLDNGANVNQIIEEVRYRNIRHHTTPLISAFNIYNETSELIGILLKYGANVNDRNSQSQTALYQAIARPLVQGYGHWGKRGYKPELERYKNDSLETIKLLLAYGADVDIETKNSSIKELLTSMKKDEREFIVDFANEVDLLLDLYQ